MKGLITYKKLLFFVSCILVTSCTKELEVEDIALLNTEKEILKFTFLANENDALDIDVVANINKDDRAIRIVLPVGTNVTALKPEIRISETASIVQNTETSLDFTSPITYSVMAEDGSVFEYTVNVRVVQSTPREILLKFFDQNPNNTLGWNLISEDISTWEGVVVVDDKVVELELAEKGLTVLPPEICDLFYLKTLMLENNMIREIPLEIRDLSNNLRTLNLGGNQIEVIPDEFFSLRKLIDFRIYTNLLTEIPSGINKLTELRELSISNNSLRTLPSELFELPQLTTLFMNNIELLEVPEEIVNLSQLTSLGVSSNPIGSIPDEILDLSSLTRLDMYDTNIRSIPSGITKLSNLRRLQLSQNNLREINKNIGDLFTLESLLLTTNNIEEIPTELSNLINLKTLNVTENSIVSMPQAVCDLINTGTEILADANVMCQP